MAWGRRTIGSGALQRALSIVAAAALIVSVQTVAAHGRMLVIQIPDSKIAAQQTSSPRRHQAGLPKVKPVAPVEIKGSAQELGRLPADRSVRPTSLAWSPSTFFIDERQVEAAERANSLAERQMWLNAMGAALVLITLFFTARAAIASERAVKASEAAVKDLERAFLFVSGFPETKMPDGSISVQVEWTNSGKTPTRRAYAAMQSRFFDDTADPTPASFSFPPAGTGGTGTGPVLVGPNCKIYADHQTITAEQSRKLLRREGRMFLWGWVEYDDVFSGTKRHTTRVCAEVTIARAIDQNSGAISYEVFKRYNSADDECEREDREDAARPQ